jgi:hypothetical protein
MIHTPTGKIWIALALALLAGTGFCGEADRQDEELDAGVLLGEEDLAERAEIARNMFRRITPGDEPFVQDVGTWPVAWEAFPSKWGGAATGREYGAWAVPVSVEQGNGATVIRDADDMELWRGTTDFAKEESATVVLTGRLVAEDDWEGYEAVRDFVENASRQDAVPFGARSCTNGLRFTGWDADTNGNWTLDLAWEEDGEVDVFAYAVPCVLETVVVTWTNDENQVETATNTVWHPAGANLSGFDSDWEWRGTASVSNGAGQFVESGIPEHLGKLRFYAAAEANDTDGDGLNDGMERFVHHTDPEIQDSDGDGIPDGADPYPAASNVFWMVRTTNAFTNCYFIGNQYAWTNEPELVANLLTIGVPPTEDSVVVDVRIDGYVDDNIQVDGSDVDKARGPKTFVNRCVTNEIFDLQSGMFVLSLYDWPAENHHGANEARLGDANGNPFRVEWTWKVPIAMRMEPIFSSTNLPLDNPSGVVFESNTFFHVEVVPAGVVPEEAIVWNPAGNKLSIAPTNRGSRVQVQGAVVGEEELHVAVEGAEGQFALPPFHVKVIPMTVVTAKVGLVVHAESNVVTEFHVDQTLSEANLLLAQIGLHIVRQDSVEYIADTEWEPFYDLNANSSALVDALLGKLSQPDGLEVYFVHAIMEGPGGEAMGFHVNHKGIVMSATGSGRTLAHEVGHACGMPDIYVTNSVAGTSVTGAMTPDGLPDDWGKYGDGGESGATFEDVLPRLLMYGYATGGKGDVPSGSCMGLGYLSAGGVRYWNVRNWEVGWGGISLMPPNHNP